MQPIAAKKRPTPWVDDQGTLQNHDCWDLRHVWPDGFTVPDTKMAFTSYVVVSLVTPSDGEIPIKVWLPQSGGGWQEQDTIISWGRHASFAIPAEGLVSVVPLKPVEDLDVSWELQPWPVKP